MMIIILPLCGAIFVEFVKITVRQQFTPVHPWLDGSQPSQYPDLLYVADEGVDVQPLALGVDGVEAAHQVLQEQLECLRQTEHSLALKCSVVKCSVCAGEL